MKKLITVLLLLLAVSISYSQRSFNFTTAGDLDATGERMYDPSIMVFEDGVLEIKFAKKSYSLMLLDIPFENKVDKDGDTFIVSYFYFGEKIGKVAIVAYDEINLVYIMFKDGSYLKFD